MIIKATTTTQTLHIRHERLRNSPAYPTLSNNPTPLTFTILLPGPAAPAPFGPPPSITLGGGGSLSGGGGGQRREARQQSAADGANQTAEGRQQEGTQTGGRGCVL